MNHIQELQEQITALKTTVRKLTDIQNGFKLPDDFNVYGAIKLLTDIDYLDSAFNWSSTPQGGEYWSNLWHGNEDTLPDEAMIQVQKWIILALKQK
jgi:hypothetical protein